MEIIFTDYQSAKKYAESSYWVEPIEIPLEQVSACFNEHYRIADWSESGKVHYSRRQNGRK
jgi:hypothetical protein